MRKDVGPAERRLRPRHAAAGAAGHRRAQDQAHPALGQGAARHRHPARRHRPALRPPGQRRDPRQDRALHGRRHRGGHPGRDGLDDLRGAAPVRGGRPRRRCSSASSAWRTRRRRRTSRPGASWSSGSSAPSRSLEIALVGKYIELPDAYLSVTESLKHAGWAHEVDVKVRWVDLGDADRRDRRARRSAGARRRSSCRAASATAASRARSSPPATPASAASRTSGLCLGLQCAVIEFARDVLGTRGRQLDRVRHVHRAPGHRLHARPARHGGEGRHDAPGPLPGPPDARLEGGTRSTATRSIYERHRHRFEVNNRYRRAPRGAPAWSCPGQSPDGRLVEIVELRDHPWFVASQFHPEFRSRPERPHPLFDGFVAAAVALRDGPRAGAAGPPDPAEAGSRHAGHEPGRCADPGHGGRRAGGRPHLTRPAGDAAGGVEVNGLAPS